MELATAAGTGSSQKNLHIHNRIISFVWKSGGPRGGSGGVASVTEATPHLLPSEALTGQDGVQGMMLGMMRASLVSVIIAKLSLVSARRNVTLRSWAGCYLAIRRESSSFSIVLRRGMADSCNSYCLGIKILYSMNTFHLSNPELILNLPRLLLPSRLAAITSLEMLWKIHPFREEDDLDPPYSGYETFLALAQKIPIHFKGLRNLYISLQGDLCMGNGSGDIDYTGDSKQKFDLVEDRLITPVEAMIRNLSCIETCVIALPSSCYGPEKCVAMESGSLIFERRSIDGQQEKRREELWRELGECSSPGFHGYWIQLGHRDLRILEMGCGIGSAPVPKDHPLNVLYELCRSPW